MALPATGYDTLVLPAPSSDLTDFTFLVDEANQSADWWAEVDTADGTKGRAAKDSDATELASDSIAFDDSGETGRRRIQWPGTFSSIASSANRTLRLYPPVAANSSYAASDTYGSDNAYDGNWALYLPCDGDANDRTANGNDGTVTSFSQSTGKIGNAYEGNGATGDINCGSDSSIDDLHASGVTFLWWMHPDSDGEADNANLFYKRDTTSGDGWVIGVREQSGSNVKLQYFAENGTFGQDGSWISSTATYPTTGFTHAGVTYNSSSIANNPAFYKNGTTISVTEDRTPAVTGRSEASGDLIIGNRLDGARTFDGDLDEIQIHSTIRAAAWIAYEYNQTSDNATYLGTRTWNAPGTDGDIASTLPMVSAAAAGEVLVAGDVAVTLPMVSAAAAGEVLVAGDVAVTLPMASAAATGTVTSTAIDGDVAVTLPMVSAAAAGEVLVAGDVAVTLPMVSAAAAGEVLVAGDVAVTLPMVSAAATGSSGQPTIAGDVAVTLPMVSARARGLTQPATLSGLGGMPKIRTSEKSAQEIRRVNQLQNKRIAALHRKLPFIPDPNNDADVLPRLKQLFKYMRETGGMESE